MNGDPRPLLRDRPVVQAIKDRIEANHPLAGALIEGVANAAARSDTATTAADAPQVVSDVSAAIASDPVLVNSMNMEPHNQSRVITGSIASAAQAIATFLAGLGAWLGAFGPTLAVSGNGAGKWFALAAMIFGGGSASSSLFALFGRLRKDLPPMTFKIWNPLSWLAPHPQAV